MTSGRTGEYLLHICRTPFLKNTYRGLLLFICTLFFWKDILKNTALNLVSSVDFHLTFTEKDPQLGFILCIIFYYYLHIQKLSLFNIFYYPTIFLFPAIFNKMYLIGHIRTHWWHRKLWDFSLCILHLCFSKYFWQEDPSLKYLKNKKIYWYGIKKMFF